MSDDHLSRYCQWFVSLSCIMNSFSVSILRVASLFTDVKNKEKRITQEHVNSSG
jgi:hypothetical protein